MKKPLWVIDCPFHCGEVIYLEALEVDDPLEQDQDGVMFCQCPGCGKDFMAAIKLNIYPEWKII